MQVCCMFIEIRVKATFDSSFQASENSTSSDEEQEDIGEIAEIFAGVRRLKIVPK